MDQVNLENSSEEELFNAVKESLTANGTITKIKSELRIAIMSDLDNCSGLKNQPRVPDETLFINELIREFFSWNGFQYTEEMFISETGQSKDNKMPRKMMMSKLGISNKSDTANLPLLYLIVDDFIKNKSNIVE